MMYQVRYLAFVFLVLLAPAIQAESKRDFAKVKSPTFEKHIRPILKAYCFECHGEGRRLRGSLDLRLARLAKEGGDSGPALVPGKAAKSLLVKKIRSKQMPPGKAKLDGNKIALIERWITGGAKTERPEPKEIGRGIYITPEERAFWSFQPIRRPAVPKVKHAGLVQTPLDAFLLRKLEEKGLSFSPEADRITLIRRAYFDLIGLPPTPKEVQAFVADKSADAYEKLIDRLLASPHYGERWGRHWLDVAGYADSEGFSNDDVIRPYAYKYRDYVIRAFNRDMPMDQFIREQLAGDEMVKSPLGNLTPADQEKLIATGFLRMAPDGTGGRGVDQPVARNQVVADTIQIVSSSLLGLTVHCAQCHNHKYDPISQADYYRVRAIFEPALDWKNWRVPAARRVTLFSAAERKKAAEIEKEAAKVDKARLKRQEELVQKVFLRELAKIPEEFRDAARKAKETPVAKRTPAQKKLLRRFPRVDIRVGQLRLYDPKSARELQKYVTKAKAIRAKKPTPDFIRALTEIPGKVPTTFLFKRGEHEQPDEALNPAGLTILQPLKLPAIPVNNKSLPTTGRRLALARRLTSGQHPLTARVLVNRVWLHHFGRGIVASPGDFGLLGERPSHSELLDWLADDFMKNGWKLKRLHKLIMTSRAYRQSSQRTAELQKIDPDNHLLGRMSVRRLEAEIIRDAILSISGKFNTKQYGKPVPVTVNQEGQVILGVDTRDGAGRFTGKAPTLGGEEFRRSVYVQVRRSEPLAVLDTFDTPIMSPNCNVRNTSTVAPQSLMLMNSKFMLDYAKYFAGRVQKEAGKDVEKQVAHGWQLAYAETPSPKEVSEAARFVQAQAAAFRARSKLSPQAAHQQALANYCQALLSANRFLYVD